LRQEKETAIENLKQTKPFQECEQQLSSIDASCSALNNNTGKPKPPASFDTGSYENSVSNIQATEINSINGEVSTYQNQKKELESNIESLKENISYGSVTAQRDGTVNLLTELVEGNFIDAGVQVMTVIPTQMESYVVEAYVENNDIGKLEEGQEIKYEVAAFPSSEYGNMIGELLHISEDIKVDEASGSAYYIVEGSVINSIVRNEKGETKTLKTEWPVRLRLLTRQESVLRYLLEKISLLA
jgi:HlyD family secretion protein